MLGSLYLDGRHQHRWWMIDDTTGLIIFSAILQKPRAFERPGARF